MSAIILGWDPSDWNRWNYASVVERVAVTGLHLEPWGEARAAAAGTEAWLLAVGSHGPGLIGHGVVLGAETERQVAFDALLPLGDQVAADVLLTAAPGIPWTSPGIVGMQLGPGDGEAGLRRVWAEFGPAQGPAPAQLLPGTYPEEAVARVPVNRYERDPEARRACIAHRGTGCAVCGFSFEAAYGQIGRDFIDVHHVVPPLQLGAGYQLDPLTDLVPLCANCHAMAHRGVNTPRTEVELRQAMSRAGFLTGSVVTPEQLEAQHAARELLGPQ